MAGYDRPGGPGWPAPGFPEEYTEPPLARGPGWAPDDDYGYGPESDYPDRALEEDFFGPEPDRPPSHRRPQRDDGDKRRPGRKGRGNILWRWRRPLFIVALLVMAMIAGGVSVVAQVELPDAAELQLSSFICAADIPAGECSGDNAVARLSGDGNREFVQLDDVPQVMIDAVIAAEDRQFFVHDGIDPLGIARALYRDLRGGGLSEGGSTITQQFVKNTYLQSERTITRKIREAVLAIKVEQEMSKEEILEGYLNTIYFGRHAYGIRAASRAYFGMDLTNPEFGLEEASYLAGLIRAPGVADAGNPEQLDEATRRQDTVLDAMREEGYIDQAQQDVVEAMDLSTYVRAAQGYRLNTILWGGGANGAGIEYVTSYVQDQVVRVLRAQYGWSKEEAEAQLARGGYRVYTTIDKTMQQQAYDAVYRHVLTDPADPSAGLVAIDSQGQVKAMVGGRDFYADNNYAQVNFAVMGENGRQVGSTFKAIALATAAQAGFSFERTELPAPSELELDAIPDTQCETRTYRNYQSENAQTGTLNLFEATAASSNTAFVGLMYELGSRLGPNAVVDMANELGMDRLHADDPGATCIPTVLGANGSSPLEMAEVYSTFANRGVHQEPTIITRIDRVNADGDPTNVWQWRPQASNVLSQTQADLVTSALQGVVDHGTGTGANIGRDAAGKTGTTSQNKDAWFVGYVPQLTAAVWMGYPEANWQDPTCDPAQTDENADNFCQMELPPMRDLHGYSSITGGSLPATIWADFMAAATANIPVQEFAEPTPEQRQDGTALGDGLPEGAVPPPDTVPQGPPPGPNPGPQPSTPITIEPPDDTSTTTSSTDTTLFPFPTTTPSTEPPRGGGGGPP